MGYTCFIYQFSCSSSNSIMTSCFFSLHQPPSSLPFPRSFCSYILQELLPLVLSFELPAIMQSDPSSPTVQHISQTYNLTVSFQPPPRLYRATGVVRGSQNNANAVKVRKSVRYWNGWKCWLVMLVGGLMLPVAWYVKIKHKTTQNYICFFLFVLV